MIRWPLAASLALLSCNVTPAAFSLSAKPKVISGAQRSRLSIEAQQVGELPGAGAVTLSAPVGELGTDTVTLDELGSARTTFSCPGCEPGIVPVTATWRSRRGDLTAQTEVLVTADPFEPTTPVDGGRRGGPCVMTLSVSLNGDVPCYLTATASAGSGPSAFRYSIQGGFVAGGPSGLSLTLSFLLSDLRVRRYAWSDRAPGGALVIQSGTLLWGPTGAPTGNDPVSFVFDVSSVTATAGGYSLHGTLDAELAPQRAPGEPALGPEWNVKVQASF